MTWRDWLEVVYWIAGIVIALSVVAVFRQVQLAKKALQATLEESEMRSEREAIVLAARQCERYAEKVIALSDKVGDQLKNAGMELRRWELSDDKFGPDSIEASSAAREWLDKYMKVPGDELMVLLNEMEAFAIYFAKGAADEKVAFSAVGPVFCSDVRTYAPVIINCRRQSTQGLPIGPFQNTIELYRIWSARARQNALRAQAKAVASEVAKVSVPEMPAVGTRAARKGNKGKARGR